MSKSSLTPHITNREADIIFHGNQPETSEKPRTSGVSNRIKNIFSNFNSEDILLLLILFLLMEEGVDDDFLVIGIILLILT